MFCRNGLILLLALAVLGAHAQVSHDFSNNLAGDLGPLISLLGDSMTRQYLSESTTFVDYIIFALAPIGILTVLVSVIRVCGSTSLRAFIGRAQEGSGVIEAELSTSTSRDVCELFNNGGITRVLGKPNILEVIYIPENCLTKSGTNVQTAPVKPKPEIVLFRDYLKRISRKSIASTEEDAPKGDWHPVPSRVSDTSENLHFPPNPNLTLNVGIQKRSSVWFYAVATLGFLLQAAVLITAVLGTYRYPQITNPGAESPENEAESPENESQSTEDEAEPSPNLLSTKKSIILFIVGTALLTSGMFACAMLIGEKTRELVFKRSHPGPERRRFLPRIRTSDRDNRRQNGRTELFWLQPGEQIIGDQTFDAFAYTEHEKEIDKYIASRLKTKQELQNYAIYTWVSVFVTAGGFICQFIGLRGLGPIIALAQLGITITMSFIRGILRSRSLEEKDNKVVQYLDLVLQHELDWLAFQLPRNCKVATKSNRSDDKPHDLHSFFVVGHRWSASPQIRSQSCSCIIDLYEMRIRLANLTGHHPVSVPNYEYLPWEDEAVKVRKKSKQLARVLCETAEILHGGDGSDDIEITIPIAMRHGQLTHNTVTIILHAPTDTDSRGWWLDSSQLESVLGLWLWSLRCNTAQVNTINYRWESQDKFIGKGRIVAATPVSNNRSKRDDLQTQLSLWMGRNSGNIEQSELCFDPLTSAGPADLFNEGVNEKNNMSSPTPLRQLVSVSESGAQKPKRFFGWTAVRNVAESIQSSSSPQQPQVNASHPVAGVSTPRKDISKRRITIFYVTISETSEFPDLLLDECVRDIYCLALTRMTVASKVGRVSTEQKFGQLRLKNATISALADAFIHPDNDLGSSRDAHLCILPAFHDQLAGAYGNLLLSELVEAANASRKSRQWQAAEKFLFFADSAREKALAAGKDNVSTVGTEQSIVHLAELYRWALTEQSDPMSRQFAYDGIQKLGDKLVDQASHHVQVDVSLQNVLSRYTALTTKIAHSFKEKFSLSSTALQLIDKLTFENDMKELDLPIPADSLFDKFRRTIESVDNTLTEDQLQFCFSIKNRVRTRALYYFCKSEITTAIASRPVLHQFLALAASHQWTEIVDVLLELGFPVDSQDESGKTALIHFAAAGNHDRVLQLIDKGAIAYHEDKLRCGALFYASKNGHDSIAKALLDLKIVYPNGNADAGFTPLSAAAYHGRNEVVKLLLSDSRTEPDGKGQNELTPIIAAVIGGNLGAVKLLWAHGVEMEKFALGHPLLIAAFLGRSEIVQELITDKKSPVSPNLDHPSIDGGKLGKILNRNFDKLTLRRRTAITLAAEQGHLAVVEFLLNQPGILLSPAKREIHDDSGRVFLNGALWYAAASGHEKVIQALLDWESPRHPSLHTRGTIIRKLDEQYRCTPLEVAFARNHSAALQTLLKQYPWSLSSSLWTRDSQRDYNNPDSNFVRSADNALTSVETLLHEIQAPISSEAANVALTISCESRRVPNAQSLLDSGLCDPNLVIPFWRDPPWHDPEFDGIEIELDIEVGLQRTLLFDAAVEGEVDLVAALLTHPQTDINTACRPTKFSQDPNVEPLEYLPAIWCIFDRRESSALGSVASILLADDRIELMGKRHDGQHYFAFSLKEQSNDSSVLAILNHRKFDIKQFAIDARHPLCKAAEFGLEECVEKMLTDLDDQLEGFRKFDNMNENPLYHALENMHFEIVRLLLADGRCVSPAVAANALCSLRAAEDDPSSDEEDIVCVLVDYIYDALVKAEDASALITRSVETSHRRQDGADRGNFRDRKAVVQFFLSRISSSSSSSDESE